MADLIYCFAFTKTIFDSERFHYITFALFLAILIILLVHAKCKVKIISPKLVTLCICRDFFQHEILCTCQ